MTRRIYSGIVDSYFRNLVRLLKQFRNAYEEVVAESTIIVCAYFGMCRQRFCPKLYAAAASMRAGSYDVCATGAAYLCGTASHTAMWSMPAGEMLSKEDCGTASMPDRGMSVRCAHKGCI